MNLDFSEMSKEAQLLMADSYQKLCTVPFPIEAARAPTVMHYESALSEPTLIFECNAAIHANRVEVPNTLRVGGVPTKQYAMVKVTERAPSEIESVTELLEGRGYGVTTIDNGMSVKLCITWDDACINALNNPEIPEE